jgi:ESX secretion system ATPase EccB
MPSRQDQLHSYQFTVQRVVAALVMRETDPARSPFRRLAAATFAGVLVAALGVAGFAVWGLLQPGGSTQWRSGTAVIVERETGATFVFLGGQLHPVVNYTSALLIVGGSGTSAVSVARRSLAGVPRGVPLGIPGAPDSLPARADLSASPWSVCSRQVSDSGAAPQPRSLLLVGAAPGAGSAAPGGTGLLVATPDGTVYLVWNNRRLLIREPDVVLNTLVWSAQRPVAVAPALVNALPAGADIARIAVPGRGRDFPALPGARVGEVFTVEDRQYALALTDALAPITPLQAALLLGDPQTVTVLRQTRATRLSAGQYAAMRKTELPGAGGPRPDTVPPLATVDPAAPVCAVVTGPDGVGEVRVGGTLPHLDTVAPTRNQAGDGAVLADDVYVPAGGGAIVEALPAPHAAAGTVALVTDLRMRYPVTGADVLATLGYPNVAPVRLPAEIVTLLPAGPALDQQAARVPV